MRPRRFRTERVAVEHRKRVRVNVVLYGVLGVSICLAILAFSWSPLLAIDRILVVGKTGVPKEALFDAVEKKSTGRTFFLFSKRNILFLQKNHIREELHASFPRLGSVEIERDGLHRIVVSVSDRVAEGMWCPPWPTPVEAGPPEEAEKTTDCYFIDEVGFAFDKAPRITGEVFMVYRREMPD